MGSKFLLILLIVAVGSLFSQSITKPLGCFAGTNGVNPEAMANPQSRGVLVTDSWRNIETRPGVFDFSGLDSKIQKVKGAGLPYALAVGTGALGSPAWFLNDSAGVGYEFFYRNEDRKLAFWWEEVVMRRTKILINALGEKYSDDPDLSHVYISQVTVNGIEGHLNGIDIDALRDLGFTEEK